MAIDKLDLSLLNEEIRKRQEEKINSNTESIIQEIPDETLEIFKKIIAKQEADSGNIRNGELNIFNLNSSTIKILYRDQLELMTVDIAGTDLSKGEMLDKFHKQLALQAKQMGVMEKLDDKTRNILLKEQGYGGHSKDNSNLNLLNTEEKIESSFVFKGNDFFTSANILLALIIFIFFLIIINYSIFRKYKFCKKQLLLNNIKYKNPRNELKTKINIKKILLSFFLYLIVYFFLSAIIKGIILLNNPAITGKLFIIDISVIIIITIFHIIKRSKKGSKI